MSGRRSSVTEQKDALDAHNALPLGERKLVGGHVVANHSKISIPILPLNGILLSTTICFPKTYARIAI